MIKKDIGANAGIIRQLLNEKKTLLISEIQTKTKLSSENNIICSRLACS